MYKQYCIKVAAHVMSHLQDNIYLLIFLFFCFQKNGFFVESGAFDGETLSNSLLFELHRNWTGLLIEPLSAQFNKLRRKHRKAFIIKACLSKDPYPIQVYILREIILAIFFKWL